MARGKTQKDKKNSGANLEFEAQLWQAADALRNNMDAAEYKHNGLRCTAGMFTLVYA